MTGEGRAVYRVPLIGEADRDLPGRLIWPAIRADRIRSWQWTERPAGLEVLFRLFRGPKALHVRFDVEGETPTVSFSEHQDPVYRDSCVEFFFRPAADKPGSGYFNFEVNAAGAMLAAFGPDRDHRTPLDFRAIEGFGISAVIGPSGWSVEYSLPFEALERKAGTAVLPGPASGNFYKCGDDAPSPHYGAWNRIVSAVPDFHLPECFGILEFPEAGTGSGQGE